MKLHSNELSLWPLLLLLYSSAVGWRVLATWVKGRLMSQSVEITLPVKFSLEAQSRIVGSPAPDYEEVVHHGKLVPFGPITVSASIKLQKAMNYRARTTLNISWEEATSRLEARTAFLFFLRQQGVSERSMDYYGALFDNALAFDEEGVLV